MKNFVPFNLGLNHIARQKIIDEHTSTIARQLMCAGESDKAIIVVDGTYIYIQVNRNYFSLLLITFVFQKSRNNNFQRKSYSLHKKRSLLKPMMIVSTTGYIIACMGPFFSDFSNNDAAIMKNILNRNSDKIVDWLQKVCAF